mmetsp:Transcript_24774/g.84755  ORF Transcript_24774/g.84755 Transcript_24774/m.84755 type:complete len:944 (+) Transcript_24774:189-3020(+)
MDFLSLIEVVADRYIAASNQGKRRVAVYDWWPLPWCIEYDFDQYGKPKDRGLRLYLQDDEVVPDGMAVRWIDSGQVVSIEQDNMLSHTLKITMASAMVTRVTIAQLDSSRFRRRGVLTEVVSQRHIVDALRMGQKVDATVLVSALVKVVEKDPNTLKKGESLPSWLRKEFSVELFNLLDADGSRYLDYRELGVCLMVIGVCQDEADVEKELEKLEMTREGTKKIKLTDFEMYVKELPSFLPAMPISQVKDMRNLFDEMDEDSEGTLDADELLNFLTEVSPTPPDPRQVKLMLSDDPKGVQDGLDFVKVLEFTLELQKEASKKDQLREVFMMVDTDGGGSLDRGEVETILKAIETSELLLGLILNRMFTASKELDPGQFAELLQNEEKLGNVSIDTLLSLKTAFSNVDADNSGVIQMPELGTLLAKLNVQYTDDELVEWTAILDEDGNGDISFKEFLEALAQKKLKDSKISEVFTASRLGKLSTFTLQTTALELRRYQDMRNYPFLERVAIKVIKHFSLKYKKDQEKADARAIEREQFIGKPVEPVTRDGIQPDIRKTVRKNCGRNMILRCMAAAIIGAFIVQLAETLADQLLYVDQTEENISNPALYIYFACKFGPAGLAVAGEVLWLNYDFLTTAVQTARTLGCEMYPLDGERAFLMSSITQVALELGQPQDIKFGINPLMHLSKFMAFVLKKLQKARKGVAKFLIKTLFKRGLTRFFATGSSSTFLAFLGVPFISLVNMVIAWSIGKGMMTCVYGLTIVPRVLDAILESYGKYPRAVREACFRAVAVVIVENRERHSNHEIMIKHLMYRFGMDAADAEALEKSGEVKIFMDQTLPELRPREQILVLRVFALALIVDGSVGADEKIMLTEALSMCEMTDNLADFREAQKAWGELDMRADHFLTMFEHAHVFEGDVDPRSNLSGQDKWDVIFGKFMSVFRVLA